MKHQRVTPVRWLGRLPGKIYRNEILRMAVAFTALWQAIYWGTWLFLSREQKEASILLSMAGLLATFLLLALINWWMARRARKFMVEGAEFYATGARRYALGVLARVEAAHGRYLTLPSGRGEWAVKCACGQHIGNTKRGIPNFDQPLVKEWETHVESKVKETMDKLEAALDARIGR